MGRAPSALRRIALLLEALADNLGSARATSANREVSTARARRGRARPAVARRRKREEDVAWRDWGRRGHWEAPSRPRASVLAFGVHPARATSLVPPGLDPNLRATVEARGGPQRAVVCPRRGDRLAVDAHFGRRRCSDELGQRPRVLTGSHTKGRSTRIHLYAQTVRSTLRVSFRGKHARGEKCRRRLNARRPRTLARARLAQGATPPVVPSLRPRASASLPSPLASLARRRIWGALGRVPREPRECALPS